MSLISGASKNDPAPNAFASQYISIILIIFTCIIWAYFSKATAFLAKKEPVEISKPIEENRQIQKAQEPSQKIDVRAISSMEMPDLFSGNSVNQDSLDALKVFLLNHDINAQIEILGPEASDTFIRARELTEKIASEGFPQNAAKVFVIVGEREGVRVRLETALLSTKGVVG